MPPKMRKDPERAEMVGERIALSRHEVAMTQKELAEKVGVSERSVQDWEQGRTMPLNWMDELAALFGVSKSWLYYGTEVSPDVVKEIQALRQELADFRLEMLSLVGEVRRRHGDGNTPARPF